MSWCSSFLYKATVLGDHVVRSDDVSLRFEEEEVLEDLNLKMSKIEVKEMFDEEWKDIKNVHTKHIAKDLGNVNSILLQKVDLEEKLQAEDGMKDMEVEKELDELEVERMVDEEWKMALIVLIFIFIGRLVAVVEPGITVQYWCRRRSSWRMR